MREETLDIALPLAALFLFAGGWKLLVVPICKLMGWS